MLRPRALTSGGHSSEGWVVVGEADVVVVEGVVVVVLGLVLDFIIAIQAVEEVHVRQLVVGESVVLAFLFLFFLLVQWWSLVEVPRRTAFHLLLVLLRSIISFLGGLLCLRRTMEAWLLTSGLCRLLCLALLVVRACRGLVCDCPRQVEE